MSEILDKINGPQDLQQLSPAALKQLAEEIRHHITHSVSKNGGHLASNLGAVEVSIAMHYVFNFAKDKLLWDVGHQCYAHKILTGRKEQFEHLRQRDGLSGFPSPAESEYDPFSVGHAGTAVPTAVGMALGAKHKKSDEKIVAFVGDASMVNGTSFEGLNNLNLVKRQLLVVLNDNSMAIDVTQGGIARFLSKVRLTHTYEDIRKTTDNMLEHLPLIGQKMEGAIHNLTKTVRLAVTPNRLFESMNIPYFGPVDGHDISSLIKVFRALKDLNSPAILHVYTKKGKGYSPADDDPTRFHSTGPFEMNGSIEPATRGKYTFTDAFGDAIVDLADKDDKVVAITAAMPDGTGLNNFRKKNPDRYYDVGIAESAAVDIGGGLAKQGMKPVMAIYSTFLQRGFDHMFQEFSLQDLPGVFCIDRSGVVGNDGPTHHGLCDIGYARMLPNFVVAAPANGAEMRAALEFALDCGKPVALRYPRDGVTDEQVELAGCDAPFEMGKSVTVREGSSDIIIAAVGPMVVESLKAAEQLAEEGIDVTVVNARFAKPVDESLVSKIGEGKCIITVEDHGAACGFGSALMERVSQRFATDGFENLGRIVNLAGPDEFIRAGARKVQLDEMGVTAERIAETVRRINAKGNL
ncbi:1-deoxy-D-xylulose-5-phosphate synthase [Anaerohalosphaera lusitana]|uniref:1-deoxy-D-xylulose-5-phosphate synthase n=1 Tax=Anaerohalosphaera lusitana TaxID=1936003 RepID=A0A1U9NGW5_9BACT|nr:1-deoxy-D-xylulose-5-phosphate synthase [Anaerohalosphaera lusitana]AQT67007.1 1-deoxy-D-xylulose-5-phosphate synthase [Anaerohalosphaera lusitana]